MLIEEGSMRKLVIVGLASLVLAFLPVVQAQAVASTFLTLTGQPGDPVLGGQTRTFTPDTATFFQSYDGSLLQVNVNTPGFAEFWTVELAAPPGSPLVVGTYTNAVRAAFRGPGQPGIDVFGDGVGCNQTSGTFTVNEAVYGPNHYVQTFDATFTQFCDNATAPLTGEVSIANPPPPPPLALTETVDSRGSVDHVSGQTTVTGTVSCSEPVMVFLNGTVVERVNRFAQAQAGFSQSIACTPSGSPFAWSGVMTSSNSVPFGPGKAAVGVTAQAADPAFGTQVTQHVDATVTLH
jgi:hypothetical protein